MLANTKTNPELRGSLITLDRIKAKTSTLERRTKIVCTLGPSSWSATNIAKLMDAGMNIARFNFSHGDHESHGQVLDRLREAAVEKSRNVAVMLDTRGPEVRTGFFADGASKVELTKGETLTLTTDYSFKGNSQKFACSYASLASDVTPGQQILVADGSLVLTVLSCDVDKAEVSCRIENNAVLGERKNMNLPGVKIGLPTFTEKDVQDIVEFGIKRGVEFIAASFIRKAEDVRNLKKLLADNGGPQIKIISKIENQEGLENFDEILKETDAVMVARGDLGMEIPASKVFLAQKMMIRKCNIAGKPVITATQMLESMITNPRPTRAECSDVANAVIDGTDAVMLSGETANGPYFEQAVEMMAKTVCEAETSINHSALYRTLMNSITADYGGLSMGESMSSSAVKTAIDIDAKLILVLSDSGKMANYVARFRPGVPVLMISSNLVACRQASGIMMGMHTILVDSLENAETLIEEISYELVQSKTMRVGDKIVALSGRMSGIKEQLRIIELGEGKSHGRLVKGGGLFFNRGMILSFSSK